MEITHDDLWICTDCTMFLANGESELASEEWHTAIRNLELLGENLNLWFLDYDAETEDGLNPFSTSKCDMCKTSLGGSRTRAGKFAL